MLKLMRFLKPYWWQVLLLILATAGQVYTTLQLPALMADIINHGIEMGDINRVWQIGWTMLGLAGLGAILSFVSSYFSAVVGANFSRDLRAEVFSRVLAFNLTDMKDFSTASLITRTTNDIAQVQSAMIMMLSMMLRAPLFCIIGLVMAIQTAANMSWIIVIGVAAVAALATLIIVLVMPKFKVFQKLLDKITLITRENLTGLRVIRAFNNENVELKKFDESNKMMTKLLIYVDRIFELQNPFINIIFNGMTLLCSWVGISLLHETHQLSYIGDMTAFAQYASHVMMSFLMLSILFVMLPRANVSADRVNEVLKTMPKIKWPSKTHGMPDKRASVEFKNVNFSYNKAAEKVLSNVSFKAEAGQTTAFIGSTGSGKSTLINLVPRFYEATSGSVLIDGVPIENFEKDDLMKRIGLVPQKGILFAGTVASNIKFGAPNATFEDVRAAAKIAQADSFIEKMPKKYDSAISQGGTNVSGGQKQRLSIARAVCKKPDIYVFDDAFSALDMKTDARLRAALKPVTRDSVVLIVAQRVNTIKDADQIVVLDKGKVVGKGKHLELLDNCPIYQSIVKSQFSDKEFEHEIKLAKEFVSAEDTESKSVRKAKETRKVNGGRKEARHA